VTGRRASLGRDGNRVNDAIALDNVHRRPRELIAGQIVEHLFGESDCCVVVGQGEAAKIF